MVPSNVQSYCLGTFIFISVKWICIHQAHILLQYKAISICKGICTRAVQCNTVLAQKGIHALVTVRKKP